MHNFAKKVYISVLSIILVCITVFATTYAWVGMLNNSQFDPIDLEIKGNDISEYGIDLSVDGINFFQQFGDEQIIQIKKQIIKNWRMPNNNSITGINRQINSLSDSDIDNMSDDRINYYFGKLNMDQASVQTFGNAFGQFYDMNDNVTNHYYKFDLYVSVSKIGEVLTSDYALDIYLQGNLFSSRSQQSFFVNNFTYPSEFVSSCNSWNLPSSIINGYVKVKPESSCRLSIQKYPTVKRGNVSDYINMNNTVKDLKIFEGGSHLPTYDSTDKTYSFGGNLSDQYNLALNDWNSRYPSKQRVVPDYILDRCDQEYNYNDKNQIISQEDGVGVNTMVKLTFCFWFEGWDADCFAVIDDNPVDLSLNFTTKLDK